MGIQGTEFPVQLSSSLNALFVLYVLGFSWLASRLRRDPSDLLGVLHAHRGNKLDSSCAKPLSQVPCVLKALLDPVGWGGFFCP